MCTIEMHKQGNCTRKWEFLITFLNILLCKTVMEAKALLEVVKLEGDNGEKNTCREATAAGELLCPAP